MRKEHIIPAIHDKDLKSIVKELGLESTLLNSEGQCANCAESVGMANLGGFLVLEDKPAIVCDNSECIAHFSTSI